MTPDRVRVGIRRGGELRVRTGPGAQVLSRYDVERADFRIDEHIGRRISRRSRRGRLGIRYRILQSGQGRGRSCLRPTQQYVSVCRCRQDRSHGSPRADARWRRQVSARGDRGSRTRRLRRIASAERDPHRCRRLLLAGGLAASRRMVCGAEPSGRLRIRQLRARVRRFKTGMAGAFRGRQPAADRGRHQEPSGRPRSFIVCSPTCSGSEG